MGAALFYFRLRWMLGAVLAALACGGCAHSKSCLQNCAASCPRIDPTGQALLVAPAPKPTPVPGKMTHGNDTSVAVSPARIIAPVGTEVVVLAGVCGQKGTLKSKERVEWMLAPGGVGHFVEIGQGTHDKFHKFVGLGPKKVDNTLAVGKTATKLMTLTRGTPEPGDDVTVQPGQSWISVTSPIEGTSHVTAFAPNVYGWDARKQTSMIYWVDAQWVFPPPAINPAGTRHAFTTMVTRQTDNAPHVGWAVRYEILDGPEAGFAPDGAKVVEVPTNDLGQAIVEIFQIQPTAGTNNVSVQVIRPAEQGGGRLVLGTGTTHKTWTSGQLSLRITGPDQGALGAPMNFRVEIANPSDLSLRDVLVRDELPPGMAFVGSNPAAFDQGGHVEWRIGEIRARETRAIDFQVRADRAGTFNNCITARSAEATSAQDCKSTTVLPVGGSAVPAGPAPATSQLDVQMTGPAQAAVNEEITFIVTVTNRGNATATGLVLIDRFDAGLQHAVAVSPIERNLTRDLPPGGSERVAVKFRVTRPGQLCNEVEVQSAGGLRGNARACVNATSSPLPGAGAAIGQASVSIRKTGPVAANLGDTVTFSIVVTNNGPVRLTQLKVRDNYDRSLRPVSATDGHQFIGDDMEWPIAELAPGQSTSLEVNCECVTSAPRSCNRVSVITAEGARNEAETCLEIRERGAAPAAGAGAPAPGAITLTIADIGDPTTQGSEVLYDVRVNNASASPLQQAVVTVTAPAEMQPISAGSGGPVAFQIEGQNIRFVPFTVKPGETARYQVKMRTNRAGTARVRAQLQAGGGVRTITAEESTTINPRGGPG